MPRPARAVDTGAGGTLSDVRELIAAEDWTRALSIVKRIVAGEPDNPDALNLLAYLLRHTGAAAAEGFYLKALSIAPQHLGPTNISASSMCRPAHWTRRESGSPCWKRPVARTTKNIALAAAIAGPEATRQPKW